MNYMDVLFSNTILACMLALAAWTCQRWKLDPRASHVLWLAVLLKLVAVPFWLIPVELPGWNTTSHSLPPTTSAYAEYSITNGVTMAEAPLELPQQDSANWLWLVGIIWCTGCLVIACQLFRRSQQGRFWLRHCTTWSSPLIHELARQVGLSRCPDVLLTSARVSPFVWSCFSRAVIVLPREMLEQGCGIDLRSVLIHELAHVRRRDHWVRHLEWFACCLLWWHPLIWIAKRHISQSEELCCDDYVYRHRPGHRRAYAHSLLAVMEYVSSGPAGRLDLKCGMSPKTFLRRRVEMMLQGSTQRMGWVRLAWLLAVVSLPLAFCRADEDRPDVQSTKSNSAKDEPAKEKRNSDSKTERYAQPAPPRVLPGKGVAYSTPWTAGKDTYFIHMTMLEISPKDLDKVPGLKAGAGNQIKVTKTKDWPKDLRKLSKSVTILSRPQLITQNGNAASIEVGTIMAVFDPGRQDKKRQIKLGYQAKLRPVKEKNKRIRLEVELTHRAADEKNGIVHEGKVIPQIRTQHLETGVRMNDNATLVVQLAPLGDNKKCTLAVINARLITKADLGKKPEELIKR